MRIIVRLFLLFAIMKLSVPEVNAQKEGLMASFGGATYSMDDMKYLQEYLLSVYPVEGKIISAFPPYFNTSVNYLRHLFPQLRIGAGYAYSSTGAKSDYTDYSGSIQTNMMVNSHSLGAFASYIILGNDHLDLLLFGRLDANFSQLEIVSTISASGLFRGTIIKCYSISPNASAGIELMYNFKYFSIGMDGGYLVNLPGDLNITESESKLHDPLDNQKVLTLDWTGWRAGIKVIIWLGK